MTTQALAIIDDAIYQLNDAGNVYWTEAELMSWLNAGQVEIASRAPNSNSVTATLSLVSGPKQSSPADSLRIVEFVRNASGQAVWPVDRKDMDAYLPAWSTDAANATVQHVMYNAEDDNKTFYVWPPQPVSGTGSLEIIYAKTPAYLNATSDNIGLSDYYRNPLLDYILYRAFGKDSQVGNQMQRSINHAQAFGDFLGIKFTVDMNASNKKQA